LAVHLAIAAETALNFKLNGSAQFIRLSETPAEHKVFQVAESRLRF